MLDLYARLDRSQLDGGALMAHQERAVWWLLDTPRALLADAPGLGKTLTAGVYAATVLDAAERSPAGPVLWLTEAALIGQTVAELGRFLPSLRVDASSDPAHGKRPSKAAQAAHRERFPDGPDVLVASYEYANARMSAVSGSPLDARVRVFFSLLVLDEASALKGGPGNVGWATAHGLSRRSARVVALTATPLETNPTEAWAVLAAVGTPGLWTQDVFERQFVTWTEPYQLGNGTLVQPKPEGFISGMDAVFRDYLAGVCLRRTAEQAGLRLPRQVGERYRLIALTASQQCEYDYWRARQGLYPHQRREKAARIAKNGESGLVNEAMTELARRPGEKVVIYAETLDLLYALMAVADRTGVKFVLIDGRTAKSDRTQAVATFLDPHSGVNVLIGSRVIEYGLNLQGARVLLSLDASYNPAREQQREGRICRIGSPHQNYEHITFLPDTDQNRRKVASLQRREWVQGQGGAA